MSKKIEISAAKCSKLSFESVVNFKKEPEKTELSGFEIEAYTGAVVERWWGKLAVNVSGIAAKQQMPIFKNHNPDQIVGYSTSIAKDSSFWVNGVFSDATEAAREIKGLAAEGFPWQASIGVRPKMIMELKEGATMLVNGLDLQGPAEVWMESEVVETSFVPLGADSNTRVSVFSEVQETDRADKPKIQMMRPTMDLQTLKKDHSDLVEAIVKEALTGMEEKLAKAKADGMAEGAAAEQERIKGVRLQLVPGHEALVEQMAFDGKSTAADTAMAIVAAEKVLRTGQAESFVAGAAPIIPVVSNDNNSISADDKLKAEWDKNPSLQAEFAGRFELYAAHRKDMPGVKVKNQKRGGE